MKLIPLPLKDLSGGLNDRDPASALAPNEAAILENYYTDNQGLLDKRGGETLLQYAPVKPVPFVVDASTLALWHLTEAAPAYLDSIVDVPPRDFNPYLTQPTQVPSIFTTAQKMSGIAQNGLGTGQLPTSLIDGLTTCTFETWVNISPGYSAKPRHMVYLDLGISEWVSDAWTNLLSSTSTPGYPGYSPNTIATQESNGLFLNQAFDYTGVTVQYYSGFGAQIFGGKDSGLTLPVFRLLLKLPGGGSQQFTVTGNPLPPSKAFHIRGTYDAIAAVMNLYVNAVLVGTISVPAGTTILDSLTVAYSNRIFCGPDYGGVIDPTTGKLTGQLLYQDLVGNEVTIYEARISNIARTDWPFKRLRGKAFEYTNSSGTRQLIASAEDGLFYFTGSGGWVAMNVDGGGNYLPFIYNAAEPSFWDAQQINDYLYLSDGINQPKCWNGQQLIDWGNPTTPPVLSLNGGTGPDAGNTTIAFTYLYGNLETGLSPSTTIANPGGNQVNVGGIPARFANCTGVRAYAQKQGSSTWYLWRQIPNAPGTTMQISGPYVAGSTAGYSTDEGAFGVADSSLGGTTYPQISADALTAVTKKFRFLLTEHRRMFACGQPDEPYTFRWSELDTADVFNVYSFSNATSGRGPLIAMATHYGEILISENGNATLILRGDSPSSFQQLETLHPTVGCTDHWGFVHHYPIGEDRYVLACPCKDGFYAYEGQDLQKISDKINGTFANIAQQNANKLDWIINSQAEFQSNLTNGGSATPNVEQNQYETDGLRQTLGQAGPTNQLDYMGLWSNNSPLVPGRVIAICAGPADGQFYFATDFDKTLYYTPDNFLSVQPLVNPAIGASERIIEIVKQGTTDAYLCLTDSQNLTSLTTFTVLANVSTVPAQVTVGDTSKFVAGQFIDVFLAATNTPAFSVQVESIESPLLMTLASVPVACPIGTFVMHVGSSSFSGGGNAYLWSNVGGAWSTLKGGGVLFYDLDVPIWRRSTPRTPDAYPNVGIIGTVLSNKNSNAPSLLYTHMTGLGAGKYGYNVPLNHDQIINFYSGVEQNDFNGGFVSFPLFSGLANSIYAPMPLETNFDANDTTLFGANHPYPPWDSRNGPLVGPCREYTLNVAYGQNYNQDQWEFQPGFWGLASFLDANVPGQSAIARNFYLWFSYTRREGPLWLGGTFRPQAIWDNSNGRFVFLASDPEDANHNRTNSIRTITPAGAFSSWGVAGNCVTSICSDGTNLYFWRYTPPPQTGNTTNGAIFGWDGFRFVLDKAPLATPNSIVSENTNIPVNVIPGRCGFDTGTSRILWNGRVFDQNLTVSVASDFYDYSTAIYGMAAGSAAAVLTNSAGNGGNGPLYLEMVKQTDVPNAWIVAANNLDGIVPALTLIKPGLALATDVSILQVDQYQSKLAASVTNGILSNLIFAAASGAANNFLWADRIYFSTLASQNTDSRLVQLGVPGIWTIKGEYVSPINNLGAFQAFNELTTDSNGAFLVYLRNSADPATLAANEIQVVPGSPITAPQFDPPQAWVQWRIDWTWNYDYTQSQPAAVPFLTYVDVSYFGSGLIQLPRIVGFSYLGRSYWTLALGQTDSNNCVLVWQKNRTWMKIVGWALDSISTFLGKMVGVADYALVGLEQGLTDLGALIVGRVRTGTYIGSVATATDNQPSFAQTLHTLGYVDKLLARVQANVKSWVDPSGNNQNGYVSITPLADDNLLPNSAWIIEIPAKPNAGMMRILGVPKATFGYDWSRAFALEIKTSEDATGNWVNPVSLPEIIQALDLTLEITEDAYDITAP